MFNFGSVFFILFYINRKPYSLRISSSSYLCFWIVLIFAFIYLHYIGQILQLNVNVIVIYIMLLFLYYFETSWAGLECFTIKFEVLNTYVSMCAYNICDYCFNEFLKLPKSHKMILFFNNSKHTLKRNFLVHLHTWH